MKMPYHGLTYLQAMARAEAERMEMQIIRAHVVREVVPRIQETAGVPEIANHAAIEAVNMRAELVAAAEWIEKQMSREIGT